MPVPTKTNTRATAKSGTAPQADELVETIKEAVSEAIAEREKQKAAEGRVKVGKSHGTSVFLTVILVMFIGSCLYNLLEMRDLRRPVDSSVRQRTVAMDIHLYTVRGRIEHFRAAQKELPATLGALGMPADDNLKYIPVSEKVYVLEYRVGEMARSYRSTESPDRLLSGGFARVAFGVGPTPAE